MRYVWVFPQFWAFSQMVILIIPADEISEYQYWGRRIHELLLAWYASLWIPASLYWCYVSHLLLDFSLDHQDSHLFLDYS